MTYSILARDPGTGELGVAVQSHWFSVGSVVTWARAGVGAVATQAMALQSYGPLALERLAAGASAPDALTPLLEADAKRAYRQVAVLDSGGQTATHTGERCIDHAGHRSGPGVSCQANMMAAPTVPAAMLDAFSAASGPLPDRLLAALDAAEAEGGDARGRQSAALLVVPADGRAWETVVELRVEDDPEPLAELRRLLVLHEAYRLAGRAEELSAAGAHLEAAALYRTASELVPDSHELLFWGGLGLALGGEIDSGARQVGQAIAIHPGWRDLLARLSPEIAPSAAAVRAWLTQADELGSPQAGELQSLGECGR